MSSYEQAVQGSADPSKSLMASPILRLHKELPDAISVRVQQTLLCSVSAANSARSIRVLFLQPRLHSASGFTTYHTSEPPNRE